MTDQDTHEEQVEGDGAERRMEPQTAGMLLRQAREAAGMSLDAAAQQLKLASRQVQAIEDGDYSRLPGRTFVRGFVRNYARMVHVDPETVLAALPPAPGTTGHEPPAIAYAPSIGELPGGRGRTSWARWAIPLTLVAIVAAAAIYEYLRPADERAPAGAGDASRKAALETHAARPADRPAAMPRPTTPAADAATSNPASNPAESSPATWRATPPAIVLNGAGPATSAASTSSAAGAPGASSPSGAGAQAVVADAAIDLEFRDFSWTEVRDRSGHVLMSRMMSAGQSQRLTGPPPFDLVIGNAADVSLKYNGRAIDLTPYSRQNVARFSLPATP